jgi:hypothetical protein
MLSSSRSEPALYFTGETHAPRSVDAGIARKVTIDMRSYPDNYLIALSLPLLLAIVPACGDSGGLGLADAAVPDGSPPDAARADAELPPDAAPGPRCADDPVNQIRPEGWGVESHCPGIDPDYDRIFDDTVVHRFDITIAPADYQATQDDLANLFSGGPGTDADPIWVPVTVQLGGETWTHVGMRYKGNSSLRTAYQQGIRKLPFRLDFDQFEDDFPEVDDQRCFGFKKLTFSNGFKDSSLIREKLGGDLFRSAGLKAARGAFTRVHVDFGEGPVYFGLYTLVEDPSDEMLDAQFGDGSGNLYKPDGPAATWQTFSAADFDKESNEDAADWSDVQAAISALNADRTDAATWRAGLEATFDVASFLRLLALNQTVVNWDTYGCMTHNYYLYGDPGQGGRLVWFPWDLNESMLVFAPPACHPTSVMLDELDDHWPVIRYLLDDPVYRPAYQGELADLLDTVLTVEAVQPLLEAYHALVAPHVVGAEGEAAPYTFLRNATDFEGSLTSPQGGLVPHLAARRAAVQAVLGR